MIIMLVCSHNSQGKCQIPGQIEESTSNNIALKPLKQATKIDKSCFHGYIEEQPKEWALLDYHLDLGDIPETFSEFFLQWGFGVYKLHLYSQQARRINLTVY